MRKEFKIRNKVIGYTYTPFVIAEAGVNHNGRLDLALKLIDAAHGAGADAVKFQTFHADDVVTSHGVMATYQKKNTGTTESQVSMLSKLELRDEYYPKLIQHCAKRGIIFLSTPHGGFKSVDLLVRHKVPALKFGSGDLTNIPLLKYAARYRLPMILGTGMATLKEVKDAIACIHAQGNNKIVVLHCTTNYPCDPKEVNLSAMVTMMRELDVFVGYSDHTYGIEVPFMAATLNTSVIEKHFTLDKKMKGPDHKVSLEPHEFKEMVRTIRSVAVRMGSIEKKPTPSEKSMIKTVRKSIVTLQPISKGDIFTYTNICIKRPGTGLAPVLYEKILGKKAKKNIPEDVLVRKEDYAS